MVAKEVKERKEDDERIDQWMEINLEEKQIVRR